jgi:hypothetical protein
MLTREVPFLAAQPGNPFENLAFLLPRQSMENLSQLTAGLPKDRFPPQFGHEHHMVLAVPLGMG